MFNARKYSCFEYWPTIILPVMEAFVLEAVSHYLEQKENH